MYLNQFRHPYDESLKRSPLVLPHHTRLNTGRYQVGRVLGKPGGFGITYLGWDERLQTKVAIKEYLPRELAGRDADHLTVAAHSGEDADAFAFGLGKFLEEARTLAKLDHPNLVRVRDFFEENGTAYLVMDYYDGLTLAEYLARQPGGKIPEDQAIGVLLPILDGLREVHAKGFLHRDIKPANIYLTAGNRPILLDFGAARQAMGEHSRSLSVVLSEGYAPIEQYQRNGRQGPWTDVYGAAATLYTMLTGQAPPAATDRIGEGSIPGLAHLSPRVALAIRRGMDQEPSRRASSIGQWPRGLLRQQRRLTTTQSLPLRPHGRDYKTLAIGALFGAIALAGVGTWVYRTDRLVPPRPAALVAEGEENPFDKFVDDSNGAVNQGANPFDGIEYAEPLDSTANQGANPFDGIEYAEPPDDAAQQDANPFAFVEFAEPPNSQPDAGQSQPMPAESDNPFMAIPPESDAGEDNPFMAIPRVAGRYDDLIPKPSAVDLPTPRVSVPATGAKPPSVAGAEPKTNVEPACPGCPAMVRLPGGSFLMGSPLDELDRDADESQHRVTVGAFAIGKYEVTQAEWRMVMGDNPSNFAGCERCPVEQVSWHDVQDYLERLNTRTGRRYRLPTEEEWEYACRAGGAHRYCGSDSIDAVAWYNGNSGGRTHSVGQKRPNAWGLYDMSGNVWEWSDSCYERGCSRRVDRGGSWGTNPAGVRAADRNWGGPVDRYVGLGFRLVQD